MLLVPHCGLQQPFSDAPASSLCSNPSVKAACSVSQDIVLSVSAPPWEFLGLLLWSRSKPTFLIFKILQNLYSYLLMFLFWYYHFITSACPLHMPSFGPSSVSPLNVEPAYLFASLVSACQIFSSPAKKHSLIPFMFPIHENTCDLFVSSDTIQLDAELPNVLNCPFSVCIHVHQIISS